jgi:hypothetical protein
VYQERALVHTPNLQIFYEARSVGIEADCHIGTRKIIEPLHHPGSLA